MSSKPKVYVAMSGGVDSSVAAALLKKAGFSVVGVYFKPWSPRQDISYCNWREDRLDAMRAATWLGIDFKTWDFSKEYGAEVAQYMIDSYRRGITPNPDVVCNKEIKFGLFLKKALGEGSDYIATGHYARKHEVRNAGKTKAPRFKLLKGKDKNKDQSYFLWTLTQDQLKYCLFPVGGYTKPEVRNLAKKFGLANHDKKDSQGVCFVGELNMKDFLKNYIKSKYGPIKIAGSGQEIGTHDGAYYYTIGQRHGLDIKDGQGPYYVVDKDTKKNIVWVSQRNDKKRTTGVGLVDDANWIGGEPKSSLDCHVKIRYRSGSVPVKITKSGSDKTLILEFKKPVRALTPGQSAVFYKGQEVLGGGIMNTPRGKPRGIKRV